MGEAIATQKYWVSINYVGVGRFAVAIGSDVSWGLKARNVKKVRDVYENIKQQTFRKADADIYKRIGADMDIQMDKLGLSLEQTEILYNLEYYKTLNDIERTNIPITREGVKELKTTWLQDWAKFISDGFESFTQVPGAKMHWYTMDELQQCIAGQNPNEPWYRLILLEAMLFEPYYPLGMEKDKKGNDVPCKKYKHLNNPINGFKKSEGDRFLNEQFTGNDAIMKITGSVANGNKKKGCFNKIFTGDQWYSLIHICWSIMCSITNIYYRIQPAPSPPLRQLKWNLIFDTFHASILELLIM